MRTVLGVIALSAALMTGGSLARQALFLSPGPIVAWRCPHCGAGNAGDSQSGFRAVCRVCADRVDWDDLAPAPQDHVPRVAAVDGRF